jgi:hypothetical protein
VSALDAQVGAKKESVYGTPVVVDRFFEFNSESVTGKYGRVESNGLRPGRRHRSDTRFTTYIEGAEGDIKFEVGSKSFGFWLDLMVGGTVVTSGPTDSAYTHTAAGGSLLGKSFTGQIGRPLYDGSSVQAFTYPGGKVDSWELANDAEGNLMCTLGCDFQTETTATGLAVAAYPTGIETFSWVGATLTIGGTQVDVTDTTISQNNGLKRDRRYLRNNGLKKEPVEDDYRETQFSLSADFDSLTQRNRVASATAAGAIATMVARWEGKTLLGATTYPALVVTLNSRLDEFAANVDGPASLQQTLSGLALGSAAVSLAYTTLDATP